MAASWTQATVHMFDQTHGSGSVITDHGVVIPFDSSAWESGALRTMRPGQRLQVLVDPDMSRVTVTAMTLVTFPTTG
jgi:cold shock CspA family protein